MDIPGLIILRHPNFLRYKINAWSCRYMAAKLPSPCRSSKHNYDSDNNKSDSRLTVNGKHKDSADDNQSKAKVEEVF